MVDASASFLRCKHLFELASLIHLRDEFGELQVRMLKLELGQHAVVELGLLLVVQLQVVIMVAVIRYALVYLRPCLDQIGDIVTEFAIGQTHPSRRVSRASVNFADLVFIDVNCYFQQGSRSPK